MERAFRLFDELRHIVEGEPWPQIAEVAGGDLEGLPVGGSPSGRQAAAQRLVHDVLERPSGATQIRLELGRNVVVEGRVVRMP